MSYSDPLGYVGDGVVLCPECIGAEDEGLERISEDGRRVGGFSPFFDAESIGHNSTCDGCGSFLTFEGDWLPRPELPASSDGLPLLRAGRRFPWAGTGVRWARCCDCNSCFAFEVAHSSTVTWRLWALQGRFGCPSCGRPAVHF